MVRVSEFKVGDKVRDTSASFGGVTWTIAFGPFTSRSGDDAYLVTGDDGRSTPLLAGLLSAVPPADPRIEVVAEAISDSDGNDRWFSISDDGKHAYRADARAALAALDAMACPCPPAAECCTATAPVRYRDNHGDVWGVQPDGTYSVVVWRNGIPAVGYEAPEFYKGFSFKQLEKDHGPLTRI